jgi:outer membrane protein assembly factor BamB
MGFTQGLIPRQICCLAVGFWLGSGTVSAADWPFWRGPQRDGTTTELSGWNGTNWIRPTAHWTAQVGEGGSAPLVVGDYVFTLGHSNGENVVSALSVVNGKEVWIQRYATPRYGRNATGDEGLYSGPSSTPEYDPTTKILYTLSADGDLHAWNTAQQGTNVWKRNLYDDYRMPQRAQVGRSGRRDYGYTSSPLVYGKWLLVEVGGPSGTIVAFDKQTGKELWRSEANSTAGHTAAMALITVEMIPCVACMTSDGLLVVRLDAAHVGKTLATYPWVTDFANNIAGPAVLGDEVLITSHYNHQAMCKLKITLEGAEKLWDSSTSSKACTPVIHKGKVYVAWEKVRCLDWKTGKLEWEGARIGDAGSCIITADEKLLVWGRSGTLLLADISASNSGQYVELARIDDLADSEVWPHHAIAGKRLYCRDRRGRLICFETTR